jgi:hypothetical protein
LGVVIGGAVGIASAIATTVTQRTLETRQRTKAIKALVGAEIANVKARAERFLAGESVLEELAASKPIWLSFLPELGYLSYGEARVARGVISLSKEMEASGAETKVQQCIDACDAALVKLRIRR